MNLIRQLRDLIEEHNLRDHVNPSAAKNPCKDGMTSQDSAKVNQNRKSQVSVMAETSALLGITASAKSLGVVLWFEIALTEGVAP